MNRVRGFFEGISESMQGMLSSEMLENIDRMLENHAAFLNSFFSSLGQYFLRAFIFIASFYDIEPVKEDFWDVRRFFSIEKLLPYVLMLSLFVVWKLSSIKLSNKIKNISSAGNEIMTTSSLGSNDFYKWFTALFVYHIFHLHRYSIWLVTVVVIWTFCSYIYWFNAKVSGTLGDAFLSSILRAVSVFFSVTCYIPLVIIRDVIFFVNCFICIIGSVFFQSKLPTNRFAAHILADYCDKNLANSVRDFLEKFELTLHDTYKMDKTLIAAKKRELINTKDAYGQTMLLRATQFHYFEIVDILIQNGADIESPNCIGYNAMLTACENGSNAIVALLLKAGADPNGCTGHRTLLGCGARVVLYLDFVRAHMYNYLFSDMNRLVYGSPGFYRSAQVLYRGKSPLASAMQLNESVWIERALAPARDNVAKVRASSSYSSSTPDSKIIFERLVEDQRCDLSVLDMNGNSVLLWAIERSLIAIAIKIVKECTTYESIAFDKTSAIKEETKEEDEKKKKKERKGNRRPGLANLRAFSNKGTSALSAAIHRGLFEVVEAIIESGAYLQQRNDNDGDHSPLAALTSTRPAFEERRIVRLFKAFGVADPDIFRDFLMQDDVAITMRNSLVTASSEGLVSICSLLTNKGQMMRSESCLCYSGITASGNTPLMNACTVHDGRMTEDKIETAKYLLQLSNQRCKYIGDGESVDDRRLESDEGGRSICAFCKDAGRIKGRNNFDIGITNDAGYFALAYAVESGCVDLVALLLDYGADPNQKVLSSGINPLMIAAEDGHEDIIRLLVARGADMRAVDNAGNTALIYATVSSSDAVVKEFVYMVKEEDEQPPSPSYSISLSSSTPPSALSSPPSLSPQKQVDFKSGNMFDIKNSLGLTAFMIACITGHRRTLKAFFSGRNFSEDLVDSHGRTALQLAAYLGQQTSITLYIKFKQSLAKKSTEFARSNQAVSDAASFMMAPEVLETIRIIEEYLDIPFVARIKGVVEGENTFDPVLSSINVEELSNGEESTFDEVEEFIKARKARCREFMRQYKISATEPPR